jgi:K+-sensing histidine kinase KdpD
LPTNLRSAVIVVASLSLATLLTFPLRGVANHSLSLLFIAAVVVASRYAGTLAGITTALSSVVLFDWFFDRTPHLLDITRGGIVRTLVFCGVSILVASLEHQRRRSLDSARQANQALADALQEVKSLRGILPICVYCKQIRNDAGVWIQIETYVRQHSLAEFSHSMCPECYRKHYPEIYAARRGTK